MSKRVRILLGGTLLTLMSLYFAIYVYSITLPKKGSSDGFSASWDGISDPRITSIDPDGPATGLLQVGDDMIAIDGVKIRDNPGLLINNYRPPGTRFTLTIRRAGELRDVSILTIPYKTGHYFDPYHYISLLFLLTAWAVFLLRPDDKQAVLLAIMLATLIEFVGNAPADLPSWLSLIAGVGALTGLSFFPVIVHLFLIFPDRSPLLRRWPRLEIWLYLPFFLVILPALGPGRVSPIMFTWLQRIQWFQHLIFAGLVAVIAYLGGGLVCLVINYRAANPIARRRLRVVMAGSAAGFFNFLLLVIWEVARLQGRMPTLRAWMSKAVYITFPLVALSFVYAIARHKVIPVSLIIRRGVRYVLVSRGSVLIEGIAVILAVTAVLTHVFSRFNPPGIVIGVVSAAVAIATWKLEGWLHNKYLAPIIDRKFFRQSYDSQKIMADLADSLRSTTSLPQLCEQVATKIQTALQTESVAVLLRDEVTGDYSSGYSCEYHSGDGKSVACQQQFRLPHFAESIAKLQESGQPIEIEMPSNGEPLPSHSVELEALRQMKSALLLPLLAKEGMPGVISLGPRLGDLPFSREDKHLLMSVAGPTTFAIENARLIERMVAEARRREEIEAENEQRAKELEEARQLQFSMLPKTIPQLPHLQVAAYMKTATEVGGDYYDFHLSDNGELTIVVGDATGHGLKAGTMVTATKSLFNHLAAIPGITDIFRHSSRALKMMNLRALYMAMTMVKIQGYHMTIGSAGMPPVLIYRAADNGVEEVLIKGIPLGSLSNYVYREEEVGLSPGDVIVLMSDGFPERFNCEGEMLDYVMPGEVLIENAIRSPQQIIERFIAVGDKWADGQPQDDDVTFVVLKVC
ncbi:MAG: SpoIIE family protein phosphatase [Acidobacteriota bacterium]